MIWDYKNGGIFSFVLHFLLGYLFVCLLVLVHSISMVQ